MTTGDDAGKVVTHIYNSAVAASVISAAWELGALDEVVPAVNFAEVHRTRSFFHWLTRGSAELFRPWFWEAVDGLDFGFTAVADLGCGSDERLMRILRHYPGMCCLGIDIARPSLEVAVEEVRNAGLADRVTFLGADVRTMERRPEFTNVELLMCFMMGHKFWPRRQCVNTLRHLSALFPSLRRFLLGDATRTVEVADRDLPVFALGFELAYDMMGALLPTTSDWESVFEESGWRLLRKYWINIAVGKVIFELEHL